MLLFSVIGLLSGLVAISKQPFLSCFDKGGAVRIGRLSEASWSRITAMSLSLDSFVMVPCGWLEVSVTQGWP